MGPHLLASYQAIYTEICKHGRMSTIVRPLTKKDKSHKRITWAHDRSVRACEDFLLQFTSAERELITGGVKPKACKRSPRSWMSTALEHLNRPDLEQLLAELTGVNG